MSTTQDVGTTIQFRLNSRVKDGAFSVLREVGYSEWLRERLQKTINALDSGEMKSYSNETAKAVLHARLEARRNKTNSPA